VSSLVQNYSRSYPRHTCQMSPGDTIEVSHNDIVLQKECWTFVQQSLY